MLLELTIRAYFERTHLGRYLVDARSATIAEYQTTLSRWEQLTRNPTLQELQQGDLLKFVEEMRKFRVRSRTISNATINKHIKLLSAIFSKLDRPGPRNRDALGVLDQVPWIPLLRTPQKLPRFVTFEEIDQTYEAAAIARLPRIENPGAWWQALLVAAFNLGFRRGALLSLQNSDVSWKKKTAFLPAAADKCNAARIKPLNTIVLRHLVRIRSQEKHLFHWPHSVASWYRQWRMIQEKAEVNFHFHDLKRTCGSILATVASEWAVRYMLDHSQSDVTSRYVNPLVQLRDVVEQMPQPAAFRGFSQGTLFNKEA